MKSTFYISALFYAANSYTQSLADCETIAAMFPNTCNDVAADVNSIPFEDSQCFNVGECADYESGAACILSRKLCVTCEEVNSVT